MGSYYEGLLAETVFIQGHEGDQVLAYLARPVGAGPYPGVVFLHGAVSGWDEWTREAARRLAQHGHAALAPNLHWREAPGAAPDDAAAEARRRGGEPDDRALGDIDGAARFLRSQPYSNGKVAIMGVCSGGRQTYLAACKLTVFDAAVDCWGGRAPIDLTGSLSCPLIGIFGEDDQSPSPADVAATEAELKKHRKGYEFHSYPGAGHMFFAWTRPSYRQEQAEDGWKKVFAFLAKHLS